MKLTDYISLFYNIAFAHPSILHRDVENPSFFTSETNRKSAISNVSRTSPYLMHLNRPIMQLRYGSELFNDTTNTLMILGKGGSTSEENKKQSVQDGALEIGYFIAGYLNDLYEASPDNGILYGFDLNSIQYDPIGPIDDNYYGIQMRFKTSFIPFNVYDSAARQAIMADGLKERVFGAEFGMEFE